MSDHERELSISSFEYPEINRVFGLPEISKLFSLGKCLSFDSKILDYYTFQQLTVRGLLSILCSYALRFKKHTQ